MKFSFTPDCWQALHRMHADGVPVDLDYLYRIACPVRVSSRPEMTMPALIPLGAGFVFNIFLEVAVTAPLLIRDFGVEAAWLPGPIQWAQLCKEHTDAYCVHPNLTTPVSEAIYPQLCSRKTLPAGRLLSGFLTGFSPGPCPSCRRGDDLEATLWVENIEGLQYRFAVPVFRTTEQDWEERMDQVSCANQASVLFPGIDDIVSEGSSRLVRI